MTLEEFHTVLARILRARKVRIAPELSAKDVPGWDSLRHVVLIMEINRITGLDLSPEETISLPNIGALYDAITDGLRRRS